VFLFSQLTPDFLLPHGDIYRYGIFD
jgi:hypothetical protein